MKTNLLLCVLAAWALLAAGCGTKSDSDTAERADQTAFAPTADSSVTARQVEGYLEANKALDSLAEVYADSFATEDPEQRKAYQDRFQHAQDTLCTAAGLRGGYDEYAWLVEALANPVNEALCDSFGIETH